MTTTRRAALLRAAAALALCAPALAPAGAQATRPPTLTAQERRIRDQVRAHDAEAVALLQRVVNVSSGTMNVAGVRTVGAVFASELRKLGFTTRWVQMPDSMRRAGHLVAELRARSRRPGRTPPGKRILLLGHLDTVFEGEGQAFVREDTLARGAGSSDMKGGDVAMLQALRALHRAGQLNQVEGQQIIVVLTGDEESAGEPLAVSRRDLVDAARRSDVALAFEGGSRGDATVARRGASTWRLTVTGTQAHTAGIFSARTGYGAIFEAARILDEWRRALAGEEHLTFSPGVVLGGTDVEYDTAHVTGRAASKLNIIARTAVVHGDLRFLSEQQKASARQRMAEIAARSLPGTSAEVRFSDEYPAMAPTAGNLALLAALDTVSRALGYGPVVALDPGRRGAGDVSFAAPYVDALDGLGVSGTGAHSPDETVSLPSLRMATERAALLIHRLRR